MIFSVGINPYQAIMTTRIKNEKQSPRAATGSGEGHDEAGEVHLGHDIGITIMLSLSGSAFRKQGPGEQSGKNEER